MCCHRREPGLALKRRVTSLVAGVGGRMERGGQRRPRGLGAREPRGGRPDTRRSGHVFLSLSPTLPLRPRTSKLTQPAPEPSCRAGSLSQAHSKGGTMSTLVGDTRRGAGRWETSGIGVEQGGLTSCACCESGATPAGPSRAGMRDRARNFIQARVRVGLGTRGRSPARVTKREKDE